MPRCKPVSPPLIVETVRTIPLSRKLELRVCTAVNDKTRSVSLQKFERGEDGAMAPAGRQLFVFRDSLDALALALAEASDRLDATPFH